MPAPTFSGEGAETTWNAGGTTSRTSAAFTPPDNSLLVAMGAGSDTGTPAITSMTFSSSPALTWTQRALQLHTATGTPIVGSTAPVAAGASTTVTLTNNAASVPDYGFDVLEFTVYTAVGATAANASVQANNPSISITTTAANSAVMLLLGDWAANVWGSRTWLSPSGFNGAFVETATAQTVTGQYSTVGGYYPDTGPIGTYTIGLGTPTSLTGTWSLVAIEITGVAGGSVFIPHRMPLGV